MIHANWAEFHTVCGKYISDLPEEDKSISATSIDEVEEQVNCPKCKQRLGLGLLKDDNS